MALRTNTLGLLSNVLNDGSVQVLQVTQLLGLILIELRALNEMIAADTHQFAELEAIRADSTFAADSSLTTPS